MTKTYNDDQYDDDCDDEEDTFEDDDQDEDQDDDEDGYEDDYERGDDDYEDSPGFVCRSNRPIDRHLERLSHFFPVLLDDNYGFVIVQKVRLPPGFNRSETNLLIGLPQGYPVTPLGVGNSRVFVSPDLRFHNRKLKDVPETTPRIPVPLGPWAWFCYESIRWNPVTDNLITFVEMVRADLTNPPTE
jgi:hypothetical protein